MKHVHNFLTLIVLLISGCAGNDGVNKNMIDPFSPPSDRITRLSEMALEINYIALQTCQNSLAGRITSFRATDSHYYINALDAILCFDNKGIFIFKLEKKGRGPEEYQFITDFDVSQDDRLLIIKSNNELVLYDIEKPEITFVRKLPLNPVPANINFTGNNDILLQYSNEDGIKPYSRILIKINGDTLNKRLNYYRFTLKDGWISKSIYENISYWYNGYLFSKELQNDTLFRFDNSDFLIPEIIFISKGKGLTPEARAEGFYFSNHGNEYLQIQKIFESERFIWYTSYYLKGSGSFLIDKQTRKKYSVDEKNWLADDLAGGIFFEPKYCRNGQFYSWVDAYKLKAHLSGIESENQIIKYPEKKKALEKLVNSLNETDNPVLIVVTPGK